MQRLSAFSDTLFKESIYPDVLYEPEQTWPHLIFVFPGTYTEKETVVKESEMEQCLSPHLPGEYER